MFEIRLFCLYLPRTNKIIKMSENTQHIENQKVKPREYTEMLMNTPVCRGLELVESSISNSGIQVCKEKHEFPKHDVLIVRGQWTKTSGAWSIRVNNYYATKRHFLQIPMDTLTQCRAIIQQLKETGECQLWTGHFISIKNK